MMTRLADLPIGAKLTLLAGAASAMALLIASAAFIAYDRVSFDEATVRRVSGEAEIVATSSAAAIVFRDPEAAGVTLSALAGEQNVESAALYAADGALFATWPASGVEPPSPPGGDAPKDGHVFAGGRLLVHRAVDFEGERVGTLVIRFGLGERGERLRRYVAIVAAVSLAALIAALFVGRAARRAISAPLLDLAEKARAVQRSDFSVRAVPRGRDEVGVLVATFNEMLDGLQRRDAALIAAKEELERRVDERTQLLREAEEANRVKDQFLATLSHELRTPLNAIVGWTALLMKGQLDEATTAKAIAIVDRNARAQTKLIEDVLDVSRIVSGKLHLTARAVDVAAVARAAAESVAHAASAKRIRVSLHLDPAVGGVSGDPDRLQQVVWNLLSNAIKFTPAGGTVTLSVERTDGHVAIVVSDNGAGIDPAFLPHVFERFRQADASTTRAHGGLGLGLAIVRHLVEMHGGTVKVESGGLGRGSTFTVALPVAADVAPLSPERAASGGDDALGPDLHGLYVLVVDDEVDGRAFVETALAGHGAEVKGVGSAEEAIRALETGGERVPDAIVCDIEMPGRDGLDLIRQIRALPTAKARIPATALTAHVRPEDRVRSLVAGFQAHLGKPIDPLELASVVESLARAGSSPRTGPRA
jgi:signal transduction histidine kinase/ActR/RegA family two-component response regulator